MAFCGAALNGKIAPRAIRRWRRGVLGTTQGRSECGFMRSVHKYNNEWLFYYLEWQL
jgi:hypothetical protein